MRIIHTSQIGPIPARGVGRRLFCRSAALLFCEFYLDLQERNTWPLAAAPKKMSLPARRSYLMVLGTNANKGRIGAGCQCQCCCGWTIHSTIGGTDTANRQGDRESKRTGDLSWIAKTTKSCRLSWIAKTRKPLHSFFPHRKERKKPSRAQTGKNILLAKLPPQEQGSPSQFRFLRIRHNY